ncbi:uncharacterized protein [Rutidosis leptorrhynchoides]|uniref:uncharacterized protein n=1 Tax=Rutidosis leptorrhynchoides TaxID=125765 RepID=UPI003A990A9B
MLRKLLSDVKVAKGPFPAGPGNVKFLIVAIDYFTKWVEAKAVRTITGVQVRNFVWECIVCRFGIPRELVIDNGAHIAKDPFKTWCTDLNIIQKFTSVAHPQANGLCEVTNRDIVSEQRLMTAIKEANNKQQIAKYYNKRVRALSFDVGEWVLRNNDASRAEKLGKLGPNWEGPYQVVAVNAAGSYKLANMEGRNLPNAWHAALLKRYYA